MKTRNKNNKKTEKESKKYKKVMSDAKIKKFLDFRHIEELFLMLSLLNATAVKKFIVHYKDARKRLKRDKRIDKIILHSKTSEELLTELKNEIVLLLKKEHEDLHQNTSTLIKQGNDMLIAELRLMSMPPKIRLFEATGDKKDFYAVKKIINEIQKELSHKKLNKA
jgi:hypothetical protein